MNIDLHNHTTLCNHAEGSMEEYVLKAIEMDINVFGFSEHAPMAFDEKYRMSLDDIEYYSNEIKRLQEKYNDKIEIKYGYEVDYLPNFHEKIIIENKDVDYLIGSVHFLDKWGFDNPEFIGEYKNRDINEIWKDYFIAIQDMAKSNLFDIVGHIDLIKVFKFFPTIDIKPIIVETLHEIKKADMAIEINFAGLRKPVAEQYPSIEILRLCYELNIPITFGSDAHKVEQIGMNRDVIYSIAKDIGYKEASTFTKRERKLYKF